MVTSNSVNSRTYAGWGLKSPDLNSGLWRVVEVTIRGNPNGTSPIIEWSVIGQNYKKQARAKGAANRAKKKCPSRIFAVCQVPAGRTGRR